MGKEDDNPGAASVEPADKEEEDREEEDEDKERNIEDERISSDVNSEANLWKKLIEEVMNYLNSHWEVGKVCPNPRMLISAGPYLRFLWYEATRSISTPPGWDTSRSQVTSLSPSNLLLPI